MAYADPLDALLVADGLGDGVERVADDPPHLGDAVVGERGDDRLGNGGHRPSLGTGARAPGHPTGWDESGGGARGGVVAGPPRPRLARMASMTTASRRDDPSTHGGGGTGSGSTAVSVVAWVVICGAGPGLGLAADPPARVDDRPVGRRHRAVVRGPARPDADRCRERRDLPRRDHRRRLGVHGDRAAGQPAQAELAAHPAGGDRRDRDRRLLLLRHRADPARPSAREAARRGAGAGRELPVGPRGHGADVLGRRRRARLGLLPRRPMGRPGAAPAAAVAPWCPGSTSAPTTSPTR